jgi:Kef-type K+ transport system membrane component KefB
MDLFYVLLILLIVTRVFGELSARVGQPQLVGELLAGIVLGIVAQNFAGRLPLLTDLPNDAVFGAVTDLSVFFLMLIAGIEMRPRDLARRGRIAFPVAIGGIMLPLALGFGLTWVWLPDTPERIAQASIVGLTLAITAVPVSVTVLMELGVLNTKVGQVIVGAAVFDDVLSLLLLAIVLSTVIHAEPLSLSAIALLGGEIALFFAITLAVGWYVLPRLGRLVQRFKLQHADLSLLIVWALLSAVLAEHLELHFVVGAFAAGVLFRRRTIDEQSYMRLRGQLEALTFGFLAPLFFASIGFRIQPDALIEAPLFVAALVAAAFVGKLLGAGLMARFAGLNGPQAFAVGAGMNARGAVALIVAEVALEAGVFTQGVGPTAASANLFSTLVITAIATTVVSPVLLREALRRGAAAD